MGVWQEKYLWVAAACWCATGWVAAWPQLGPTQVIAWASALAAVYFLMESNRYLSPGAQRRSRLLMALLLVSTPALHRAIAEGGAELSALALVLGAVRYGAEAGERRRALPGWVAMGLAGAAFALWPPAGALTAPLLLWMLGQWMRSRRWMPAAAGAAALLLGTVVTVSYQSGTGFWSQWSVWHWWACPRAAEGLRLPHLLYAGSIVAHPFLFAALPPLFFLFKKTDVHLDEKKALALGLALEILLLSGLPEQSAIGLLPAWGVLLLLCFPAWDRFCSYGFYFFKKLITILLCLALAIQWIATLYILWEKF